MVECIKFDLLPSSCRQTAQYLGVAFRVEWPLDLVSPALLPVDLLFESGLQFPSLKPATLTEGLGYEVHFVIHQSSLTRRSSCVIAETYYMIQIYLSVDSKGTGDFLNKGICIFCVGPLK